MVNKAPSECAPSIPAANRFDGNARVVSHRHIVLNEYEIELEAPQIAESAQPGQFIMVISGAGYSTDVRRPFSLFRVNSISHTISVVYLARGSFTSDLARKRVGDFVHITGPLGVPFSWPRTGDTTHLLVAGGIGAPPIYFLAREISRWNDANPGQNCQIVVINAAKSADRLVGVDELKALTAEVLVVTLDGSAGEPGVATEILQREVSSRLGGYDAMRIYACGPMPMLHSVGKLGIANNLSCQVSIETAMPCGVGDCDGCAVLTIDPQAISGYAYARTCCDGPVFEADRLAWDSFFT